ncbi:helix-turn-helix domain-containing protein [Celeribacter baekdonensis]|uniref:AraC family transcriptional regulator n=1 Tax=Celeribacter baekdonensis B30 TaxID=1208323 RepID=K2ILT9_9RHOB|nr:helix-turn-helix domain-containing protein [Celeribacter baekdonensis]EKE71116.1 AraC family transcriptional regulator [Celeribacter baekdonensis B30]
MRESANLENSAPAIPIARHMLLQTSDIDEARERVGKVFCPHRIEFVGNARKLDFHQSFASIGRLALSYVSYGAEVEIDAGVPEDWFMVHTTDRGQCGMQIGGQDVLADSRTDAVSSATTGLKMRWMNNCGQLVLKIERRALEDHLCQLLNDELRTPIEFLEGAPSESAQAYRRMLNFVVSETEHEENFYNSPMGLKNLEGTLMTLVLTGFRNNYSEALLHSAQGVAPRHVRLAEDYIRAHVDEPISISDVAAAAGVSQRTLFDGFQRFRDKTPMAFLKAIRMEAVRKELLRADAMASGVSVTSIAVNWGFTNLGRFAESYRRRYGELPSVTLRR